MKGHGAKEATPLLLAYNPSHRSAYDAEQAWVFQKLPMGS